MNSLYSILFIEAEYRKVLPVIRELGRRNHRIYTISLNRFSIGGSSKYVRKNYFFKDLEITKILEIIKEDNIDLVIPCNEKSVELISENINDFQIPTLVPNIESFNICQDKLKTIRFAEKIGVRIPKTFVFNNIDELRDSIDMINTFPLVIKPRKSSGSRGIIYVNNKEELISNLNSEYISKYNFPLIQEYIPQGGKAIGASFLYYQGKEVFGFCHQRIREYPPSGGPSTLAVSIHNEEAVNIGRKLLNNLNWNGFAMVEFKEDPRNGELILMEINPRMWGTIGLAFFSGEDFLNGLIKVFLENVDPNQINKSYHSGYYFRWFFPGDFMSILVDKNLKLSTKIKKIFERHQNIIYQITDFHDLKPIFYTFLYTIFKGK